MNVAELPRALQALREEAGLTRSDLAKLLEMDPSLISKTERGASRPPLTTLAAWARACGRELSVDFNTVGDPAVDLTGLPPQAVEALVWLTEKLRALPQAATASEVDNAIRRATGATPSREVEPSSSRPGAPPPLSDALQSGADATHAITPFESIDANVVDGARTRGTVVLRVPQSLWHELETLAHAQGLRIVPEVLLDHNIRRFQFAAIRLLGPGRTEVVVARQDDVVEAAARLLLCDLELVSRRAKAT